MPTLHRAPVVGAIPEGEFRLVKYAIDNLEDRAACAGAGEFGECRLSRYASMPGGLDYAGFRPINIC